MKGRSSWNPSHLVGTSIILALVAVNAQSAGEDISLSVYGIHAAPFTMNNDGLMVPLWNTTASVFREGEKVGLNCSAGVPGKAEDRFNPQVFFYVDNMLIAQLPRKDDPLNGPIWTAAGVGTRTLDGLHLWSQRRVPRSPDGPRGPGPHSARRRMRCARSPAMLKPLNSRKSMTSVPRHRRWCSATASCARRHTATDSQ